MNGICSVNAVAAIAKRRARRIAADEAHSWARNLRLRNPYAKLVLCMITQYVQGDGTCFVGIKGLADDCELADETVRRRLAWLETVGAITRLPQWLDENGRRNGDGRGKRTTDEIRLMFEADVDVIEARAAGDIDADGDAEPLSVSPLRGTGLTMEPAPVSPPHGTGLTDDKNLSQDSISPLAAPSLRTGPNDSEPEPEGNPPPPLRGEGQGDLDSGSEAKPWLHLESWNKFEAAWREPILHQQLCRQIWSAFTDAERDMAIKVARGYVNWRASQKRPPNTCNAQKILREIDAWPRYAELAGPDPALKTFIIENSDAFKALGVVARIGGWTPPPLQTDMQTGARGFWRTRPPSADLLGLAVFADTPIEQWQTLEDKTAAYHAWGSRLDDWVGRRPSTMRVPCLFPPRKDGSLGPSDKPLATEDELNQFGKTG